MAQRYSLNFSYKSLIEDFEKSVVFSQFDDINIKQTFVNLRHLLETNLVLVENIINVADKIKDVEPIGYNSLKIDFDPDTIQELLEKNMITPIYEDDSDNTIEETEYIIPESEEETHTQRLEKINRLCKFGELSDISDNDSEDVICDEHLKMRLKRKYTTLLNKYKSDM